MPESRQPHCFRTPKPSPSVEIEPSDDHASVSRRSSDPTPLLEFFRTTCNPQLPLRSHHYTRGTRPRNDVRDAPVTPHRPVGAAPKVCVTFRHVSLTIDVPAPYAAAEQAACSQESREHRVATQLPTLTTHVCGIVAGLFASKTVLRRPLLKNVTGAFRPGSMTLVLGRAGSGKSVLLKLLSGRLGLAKNSVTLTGDVAYNGLAGHELEANLPQCIAYVAPHDAHFADMTVKETLDFAFQCCAIQAAEARDPVGARSKSSAVERFGAVPRPYRGRDPVTVTRELGLTRCQGTLMGHDHCRGVSGGERKRVTTGEMTFGPHAVTIMDDVTTGLDSSAAYDVVHAQRRMTRQSLQTVVMALTQPTPDVVALFDNMLLLAEGEVLYHGPCTQAQAYFEALGFVRPVDRELADFLCDLASQQQIPYEQAQAPLPGSRRHPRRANEFADLWIMSPMYEAMVEELDHVEYDTAVHCHPNGHERRHLDPTPFHQLPAFQQSFLQSTWLLVSRHGRLVARNRVYLVGRVLLDLVVGLMVGSVYYGQNLANVQVTLGLVFSCALFLGLGQSATLPPLFDARLVFYKQRAANFYRTSSYVVASSVGQWPLAMTEALIFSTLVYWMGGLVATWDHFLVFVTYMFLTILVFVSEYYFLSAACATLLVAQPMSTLVLLFWILFAGFAVSRQHLPWALQWIYWANPLAWTTRGILVSQYRSRLLDVCVYNGIDYCTQSGGLTFGTYSLGLYDVPNDSQWVQLGMVVLATVYAVTMWLSYMMLEYYRHDSLAALPLATLQPTLTNAGQFKDSYAMLATPHRDDFQDVTTFHDRNDMVVLEENDGETDSFDASQGIPTIADDIVVCLTPRCDVPPVTLAFQDVRYTIPVSGAKDPAGQRGMDGLPGRPVRVSLHDKADQRNEKMTRELLQGVTGYAVPGTMTALMGSTGAGKTTLLDVLAGRKRGTASTEKHQKAPTLRGRVLLNGRDATELAVRRCTGYCEQAPVHSGGSTFREALQFSAYLRQSDQVASDQLEEIVTECLELLGLSDLANQLIRNSSSEQQKRLAVGVELVAQSSVLFLDEPTSGLDARAAKSLMDGVRRVADSGRTVLCTIHQPSTAVFLLFDSLLLLHHGGETVYFGALGSRGETLVTYFQQVALPRKLPIFKHGENPATWVLEVIGAGVETATLSSKRTPSARTRGGLVHASSTSSLNSEHSHHQCDGSIDFVAAYRSSRLKQRLDAKRAAPGVFMPSDRVAPVTFAQRRAASENRQCTMLLHRFAQLYWRTPRYSLPRMVTALTLGCTFGLVYAGNTDFATYQGANSAVGLIFFSTCFLGVSAYVQVLPLAFEERRVYYRERAAETYSALWYFVASSVVEIPAAALTSLLFVSVFYPMAGFADAGNVAHFVMYWLVLTVHILFQTFWGQFFAFATPTLELAAVWGSLCDSIFLMFMGYNPPASSIPDGYKWLSRLVPHRYTFEILTALVLGDCPDEYLHHIAEAAATGTTIDVSDWPLGCHPLRDAPPAMADLPLAAYIDRVFNARRCDTSQSVAVIVGLLVLLRLATLVVMRVVNFEKR